MSEDEIIREIAAKYRRRMKAPHDTLYVVGSISSEERHNLEVLREMEEEMARRLSSR